jgi:PAS domain S-box-containing protein
MADGLAFFDAGERLVFCNRPYLGCFPRTAHLRVPGAPMRDLRREAARRGEFTGVDDRVGAAWMAAQAAIYAAGGQDEYRLADGRWMVSSVRRTARGGTVVLWHDVTERKRLEIELQRGNERYRALVEASPDAIFAHRDGTIVFANARTAQLVGAPNAESLLGVRIADLVGEDELATALERSRNALERGVVNAPWQHTLRRLDGGTVHVETTSTRTRTRLNGADAVLVIVRDVTERQQMADELARAHARLAESAALTAGVLDAQTELVCRFLPDTTLLYVNDAYARTFGGTKQELVGRKFIGFIPEAERAGVLAQIARLTPESSRRRGPAWRGAPRAGGSACCCSTSTASRR